MIGSVPDLKDLFVDLGFESGQQAAETCRLFEQKQSVSDKHACANVGALHAEVSSSFDGPSDAAQQRLKAAATAKEKEHLFRSLQVEIFARLGAAIYGLHALLLVHRVAFNIVAREASKGQRQSDGATEVYRVFLECLGHLHRVGFERIAKASRSATGAVYDSLALSPHYCCGVGDTKSLLADVCAAINAEVVMGGRGVQAFLPSRVGQGDAKLITRVTRLLDEARDYIESPQFSGVLTAVLEGACGHAALFLHSGVVDATQDARPDEAAQLARLLGPAMLLSRAVVGDADNDSKVHEYSARFAANPLVKEFGEAIFFPDGMGPS